MSDVAVSREIVVRSYPPADLEVLVQDVCHRATARAALAAAYARGRNNRKFADALAVAEMKNVLDRHLPVGAEVVIGEGERDEAPMLQIGQRLGPNPDQPPGVLIAVDPLEATNNCARGMPGAICVLAAVVVGEGKLWPGIDGYMEKLVVGKAIADKVRDMQQSKPTSAFARQFSAGQFLLDQPIEALVNLIAFCTGKPTTAIVAEILDRPRNKVVIQRLRRMHVQVRLISDGDVTAAWRALSDDQEVDFTIGIGAAAEGVIGAAMTNVLGGYMEGRCWFDGSSKGDVQRQRFLNRGIEVTRVHRVEDLAGGNVIIAFTPVTDSIMPGVSYGPGGVAYTHTLHGRSRTGTHYVQKAVHHNPPAPPKEWPLEEDAD